MLPDIAEQRAAFLRSRKIRRIIVKLGSGTLTDASLGLREPTIRSLAAQVARIRESRGIDVVVVTSGAIAAGRKKLGMADRPRTIALKQAAAAVGQTTLMRAYERAFEKRGLKVGQLLLTHEDFENRERYLNAKNTLETLLSRGIVPIINENDTVATEEIRLGDNDHLAALGTQLMGGDRRDGIQAPCRPGRDLLGNPGSHRRRLVAALHPGRPRRERGRHPDPPPGGGQGAQPEAVDRPRPAAAWNDRGRRRGEEGSPGGGKEPPAGGDPWRFGVFSEGRRGVHRRPQGARLRPGDHLLVQRAGDEGNGPEERGSPGDPGGRTPCRGGPSRQPDDPGGDGRGYSSTRWAGALLNMRLEIGMSPPENAPGGRKMTTIKDRVERVCRAAKEAAARLGKADSSKKNAALAGMAKGLRERSDWLQSENRKDMDAGKAKGLSAAMLDRLLLTDARIRQMADGIGEVIALPDPVGGGRE